MKKIINDALQEYVLISSYCKICGRTVDDFVVDDETWRKVKKCVPDMSTQAVLCAHCFISIANKNKITVYIKGIY